MMNINLYENIDFDGEAESTEMPLMVKGVSCRAGFIKQKMFIIPDTELGNIVNTLATGIDGHGAYILKDHGFKSGPFGGKSVDLLVGRVTAAGTEGRVVLYKGRIEDEDLANKIRKKLVTSSSIGLRVNTMSCSICGRPYGDPECHHRLGKEYPDEGLHDDYKDYLGEMEGKPYAAIVGTDIQAREQSVVLFPAIAGASVGLNFSEELTKHIIDVEAKKDGDKEVVEEMSEEDILLKLGLLIEGFNKEVVIDNSDANMSGEFDAEKLTEDLADAKAANIVLTEEKETLEGKVSSLETERDTLNTKVTDLEAQLDTANQVIQKYKDDENARLAAEREALVVEATALRKELELPERDYKDVSLEVITFDLETLKSVPKTGGAEGVAGDDDAPDVKAERKEDVREMIFKTRRDGKNLKGIVNMKDE